ncbi:hypothetical protein PGTUg99_024500 [Puccinia graminis f. sp. tritici]|uniref:Uncharacterized protein n=1 Tax=Puccinia graminis f. sp. tritici TaxID=56615 RepID=A0A5B0SE28_PUCGR|nr:hypothetical protein PGTUg99_024500 [Puccinia graminis f. sp. tritici]
MSKALTAPPEGVNMASNGELEAMRRLTRERFTLRISNINGGLTCLLPGCWSENIRNKLEAMAFKHKRRANIIQKWDTNQEKYLD